VIFWVGRPGDRALDYRALSVVRQVAAPLTGGSFYDAEVIGDRIYFANSADNGDIGVVAIEAGASKQTWSSTAASKPHDKGTPDPTATPEYWKSMTALPDQVALVATEADSSKRLAVLAAKDGHLLWSRTLDSGDDVYFVSGMAVVDDSVDHRLFALRLDNGKQSWSNPDPATNLGSTTSIFVATSDKELDGPATVDGRPLTVDPDNDTIVQITADREARVIDARTGTVRTKAEGVADTDDEIIADNGLLIVRQSDGTQRIVTYSLDKLGEPKGLYTAQGANNHLTHLTPCGDRICFIEDKSYDAKSDVVTAVDLKKGGQPIWRTAVPSADGLVSVGTAALVTTSSETTLLDGSGHQVWTNDGVAARLNGGNLLEFDKSLTSSPYDGPSVAGQHLGDQRVQLGPLGDVRSSTCSWNTSVIACVADKNFEIQRFTK
jgi:outer membrane protein assembly factor BamB